MPERHAWVSAAPLAFAAGDALGSFPMCAHPELATQVNVFNGGQTDLTVWVNRGPAFTVAGVGPSNWAPSQPKAGGPGFDNGGPSPNNFGPGVNNVTFQVGTALAYTVPVSLPNVPVSSLQVYLLLRDAESVEWFICSGGTVVASSYGTTQTKVAAAGLVDD